MNEINLKKIVAAIVMAGTLGFSVFGLGAGVANAKPHVPGPPGPPGPGHGHGGDWYDGDGYGPGPGYGPNWGIDACMSATGPYGNVSGWLCI
jgi:hypothetical protein